MNPSFHLSFLFHTGTLQFILPSGTVLTPVFIVYSVYNLRQNYAKTPSPDKNVNKRVPDREKADRTRFLFTASK